MDLILPVGPLVLAHVVPTFMAITVLTVVGFPSDPCETPNIGATLEVPARLLLEPAKYVTICNCILVKEVVFTVFTIGSRLNVLPNEVVGWGNCLTVLVPPDSK